MPKGVTNNPNGRPKRGRALADALAAELAHKAEYEGKQITQRELMARFRIHAALYGELPRLGVDKDGNPRDPQPLAVDDRLTLMHEITRHLDGPPPSEVDLTSGGLPLNIRVEYADPDPDPA